jgi:hypothetical protein
MSSADVQARLKEEAKTLQERVNKIVTKEEDPLRRKIRTLCIYAGLMTETLVEFDEPDAVMEQAFYRIADLLHTDPAEEYDEETLVPPAYDIDHDMELGRRLARTAAEQLPKKLDDLHEIAIALIINDLPAWGKDGAYRAEEWLRVLIEVVILSLSLEMATQDFCDLMIEDFIADGMTSGEALLALGAVTGVYYAQARQVGKFPEGFEQYVVNVMAREAITHGTEGTRNWQSLTPANDLNTGTVLENMKKIKPEIDEFFDIIGMEDALDKAVCTAKSVGRMVAVISIEDVGQIHPNIAKSLAKTGMILGSRIQDGT